MANESPLNIMKNAFYFTSKPRSSNGNQTMKCGQLIYYNMRIIFIEKWFTKCGGETSPRPFSEKLKLGISQESTF